MEIEVVENVDESNDLTPARGIWNSMLISISMVAIAVVVWALLR